ncbi:hypothetical protein J2X67_002417 [Variovorax sp. 3319]|nr:hypothetical protein [Variovorax sp. 3319]
MIATTIINSISVNPRACTLARFMEDLKKNKKAALRRLYEQ